MGRKVRAGLLYGLAGGQLLVFDTTLKQRVATVDLGGTTTDLDLSPDGSLLVGAQDRDNRLVVVDKALWTVSYVSTRADPQQVEIMNGGIAYYATLDQWSEVHRVDLAWGKAADIKLNLYSSYEPDLELSPSGERLFVGESALSPSTLYDLDLTVAPTRTLDASNGFESSARHLYLGPSGKHIYYAGYQLDATNLSHVMGKVGTVFAEDAAATFAVSSLGLVDAELLTLVTPFAHGVQTAALVRADSEVWYCDTTSGRLVWASVAELLAGKTLGVR
jgi:hypothetical protein